MAHNKKSEHLLNLQSHLNDDEGLAINENTYDYCVKLEDSLQYDSNKRDEELEMCLEEIEKNLSKLRYNNLFLHHFEFFYDADMLY